MLRRPHKLHEVLRESALQVAGLPHVNQDSVPEQVIDTLFCGNLLKVLLVQGTLIKILEGRS